MHKRSRTGKSRVTLSEVARHANVSSMTVSRVLRSPEQVSADRRQAVMNAVEELGYIHNKLAGALASRRSRAVAIVIPSLTNNVFLEMTDAIHKVLVGHGYQPLITVSDYSFDNEKTAISNILAWSPDGLVLVGLDHAPELAKLIRMAGIPVVETVQVGSGKIDLNVGIDHYRAGLMMGAYLVGQGYRNVWMVGSHGESDSRVTLRFDGCAAALAEAGLRADLRRHLVTSDDSLTFGRNTLRMVAEQAQERPAVFYGNDLMAIGALQGARELKLRVPDQIGIAGFNGIEMAKFVDPGLTTIRVPYGEMGRVAAEMLVRAMGGHAIADPVIALQPLLVAGQSA